MNSVPSMCVFPLRLIFSLRPPVLYDPIPCIRWITRWGKEGFRRCMREIIGCAKTTKKSKWRNSTMYAVTENETEFFAVSRKKRRASLPFVLRRGLHLRLIAQKRWEHSNRVQGAVRYGRRENVLEENVRRWEMHGPHEEVGLCYLEEKHETFSSFTLHWCSLFCICVICEWVCECMWLPKYVYIYVSFWFLDHCKASHSLSDGCMPSLKRAKTRWHTPLSCMLSFAFPFVFALL